MAGMAFVTLYEKVSLIGTHRLPDKRAMTGIMMVRSELRKSVPHRNARIATTGVRTGLAMTRREAVRMSLAM